MTQHRRSAGSESGSSGQSSGSGSGGERASLTQPGAGGQYLGVEDSQVEDNPDRYVGEVFRGGFFLNTNVPDHTAAGDTITITGEVQLDNPIATVVGKDIRVLLDSPALTQNREEVFQGVMHGQSRSFSFDLPAPNSPGGEMAVSLTAQESGTTGWVNGEELGPFRIDVLDPSEDRTRDALGYIPSVLVGGAAGIAADQLSGGGNRITYGLAGAALGAGAQAGGFTPGNLTSGIGSGLPDAQTIAIAGIGFAGVGFFLQSSGAAGVLGPAGEAAGSAVDAGRRVAEDAAPPRLTGGN